MCVCVCGGGGGGGGGVIARRVHFICEATAYMTWMFDAFIFQSHCSTQD